MFRSLVVLFVALLFVLPGIALAQKQGQVSNVRRAPIQGASSVSGEPVQTAEAELMEASGALLVLAQLSEAFLAEDAEAITNTMIKNEIRFSLEPAGEQGDLMEAPLQSREQIYYRLRDYFDLVVVEAIECDCSEENLGVEDAHGVLELWLEDSERSRLFVRLRQLSEGWRVTELRALP